MKRIIGTLVLTIFAALCAVVFLSAQDGEKQVTINYAEKKGEIVAGSYAIVIGINNYADPDITDLNYCEKDATRFADALKASGYDKDRVILLTGPQATYVNVVKRLEILESLAVPENSTILFYFSGHGFSEGGNNYLILQDQGISERTLERNLRLEEVEEMLNATKFERRLMFIDACRSAVSTGARGVGEKGFSGDFTVTAKGTKVFLGTELGKVSREAEDLKSGIFTNFLVEGILGAADTENDGIITISELEGYVARKMSAYSYQHGISQVPVSKGEGSLLIPVAARQGTIADLNDAELNDGHSVFDNNIENDRDYELVNWSKGARQVTTLTGHVSGILCVTFSLDGQFAITGSGAPDNTVKLWSVPDGNCKGSVELPAGIVHRMAISPGGPYALTGSSSNEAKLWYFAIGTLVSSFIGHSDMISAIAISNNNRIALTGGLDNTINLWNIPDGTLVQTWKLDSENIGYPNSMAFSNDDSLFIEGNEDNSVRVFNIQDGSEIFNLAGHRGSVNSVKLSTNGLYAVSGANDSNGIIWNLTRGVIIATLRGHTKPVITVAFSPDSKYVVTGSSDNHAKIWNVPEGECVETINHQSIVLDARFSPDSRYIILGGGNYMINGEYIDPPQGYVATLFECAG